MTWFEALTFAAYLVLPWVVPVVRSAVKDPMARRMRGLAYFAGALLVVAVLALSVVLIYGIGYWATVDPQGLLTRTAVVALWALILIVAVVARLAWLGQKPADRDNEGR